MIMGLKPAPAATRGDQQAQTVGGEALAPGASAASPEEAIELLKNREKARQDA